MTFEVIVVDFSKIRGLWETRVKKYKERCKKEKERLQMSALQKIKQEWNFMLECRDKGIPQSEYIKDGFVDTRLELLDAYQKSSSILKQSPYKEKEPETNKYVFSLYGAEWLELPDYLREQTYLKEWHINKTLIHTIPDYIQSFEDITVLDISQNKITCLPAEIGCLRNLRELSVSFNNLKHIPPELGDCENLEKLDVSGNLELTELPFELSNLKKVTFVDLSANKFSSIPICVLRMSSLQWLDISSNNLKDLPQDIDRLEELETLLMHKNIITYLPSALTHLSHLKLLVVSGEKLVEIPSALIENPSLKYVKLLDNPIEGNESLDSENEEENNQDREQFEKEFMKSYLKDLVERDSTPRYTTKVSFNLQI
ncbi:leucine-rich repeat-containing protein 2 [Bufo gargarizans]|uniref:leucine-rich repeat-containing protein 2 n=1 Tax=Bufo gargarizans TaxID=30331 RepID=UPI001CF30A90|nr:leucine-rich repeat-containing protein 2 [Bufo gargarizans]